MKSNILFSSDSLRVEHFYKDNNTNENLAFIFSPSMNRKLDGNDFGGEVFFRNGYDTISFKSSNDDWFQSVPFELFEVITKIASKNRYSKKISYGSSMGGYASIVFSRLLDCNKVIAFSPQFSIQESFDTRWLDYAKKINFKYKITQDSIMNNCKFFFIYDNKNLDELHIKKLLEIIPSDRVELIKLPFTGHPSIHYLYEVGLIKDLAIKLANDEISENINFFSNKKKSKSYLKHLSDRLLAKNKYRLALSIINSAIQIDGVNPDFYHHKSKILNNLGDLEGAVIAIEKAISLQPNDPHRLFHLSNLLYLKKDYDNALKVAEQALMFTQKSPHLFGLISLLQREKGLLKEALSSINAAIDLGSEMAELYNQKSDLHKLMGEGNKAIASLKSAIELDKNNMAYKNRLNELLEKYQ